MRRKERRGGKGRVNKNIKVKPSLSSLRAPLCRGSKRSVMTSSTTSPLSHLWADAVLTCK